MESESISEGPKRRATTTAKPLNYTPGKCGIIYHAAGESLSDQVVTRKASANQLKISIYNPPIAIMGLSRTERLPLCISTETVQQSSAVPTKPLGKDTLWDRYFNYYHNLESHKQVTRGGGGE